MKNYLNIVLIVFTILTPTFLEAQVTPIKTVVHIIRYSDGSGMSEQTAEDAIEMLNEYYTNTSTNLVFIVDQIITVNSSNTTFNFDFVDCSTITPVTNLPNLVTDALNIYFFPSIMSGSPGVTVHVPGNTCIVRYSSALSSTLAHEVGHCFGLYHTDEICNGYENVTRTPIQNCDPNCDIAGDKVCDTPAQRNPNGSSYDNCGIAYPTTNPNEGNIMDIQTGAGARTYYTNGQKQRILYYLNNYLNDLIFNVNVVASNKINDVNQSGTTLHFDEELVYSGSPVNLLYGINHISKTDQEILSLNYKHHDWDDDFSQFRLSENYLINKNFLFRTANFEQLNTANVKNSLLEVSNSDLGIKELRDPWWVDGNGNQPDDFRELTSSNVNIFLNQDPQLGMKMYTVRSPIQQPNDIYLPQTGVYHKFYFYNWAWSGTDPLTQNNIVGGYYETPVVFRNISATVTANLKGTGLSNNQNAYGTSSQRKFVQTSDGVLNYVYSSLGHVWYERSTDSGTTWVIANGGHYLDNGEGKLPSIDFGTDAFYDNAVLIVYQEKYGNNYKIKMKRFNGGTFVSSETTIYTSSENYSSDAGPVVGYTKNPNSTDKFIVVFQSSQGLRYNFGYIDNGQIILSDEGIINGTDQNSINPTIATRKNSGGQGDLYLAWQQYDTQIYYKKIHFIDTEITDDPTPTLYSYNDGFTYNWFPSISIAGSPIYPVISWVGHNGPAMNKITAKTVEIDGTAQETKIVVKRGTTGNFFIAGSNVNNVNNNSTSEGIERSVIVWSEGTPAVSKWVKRTGTTFSTTANLSNSGIQTQVSNSSDLANIKAMVFNTEGTPYWFKQATTNFCPLCGIGKLSITEDENGLTFGRTGIVGKGDVQFVFNVGDIILADTSVQFIPKPDTLLYTNTDELNQNTRSLTFHLNNQSQLFFTDYYYTVNPEIADSVLNDSDAVSFRVELIDANTNSVVGSFDDFTYTKSNLEEYDNINYRVDCSSIEEGDYYLRLVTTVVGEASYNLANVQNDNPGLEKRDYNQVSINGNEIPTVYELSQNFPNPFNPATTIKYQIPQDGLVTLKIYDILGAEVATLVNEVKTVGRYEVNFDASTLSSGVYLYRIQVNDFVSTKKMILLK